MPDALDAFLDEPEVEERDALDAFLDEPRESPVDRSVGHQIANIGRNVAAGAGSGTADALAGVLKVGADIDRATGGKLSGAVQSLTGIDAVDLNRSVTEYMRQRSQEIPKEQGIDPALAETLPAKFGQGVGSLVPAIVSGPAAPVTMAGMMGESGRRDAEAEGATESQQDASFYLNAGVGAVSEALLGVPALLRSARAVKMPDSTYKSLVQAATIQAAKGAAREGTQEGLEGTAANLIANSIVGYDPERGTFEGVPEQVFIGALVGAPAGAAVQVGQGRATGLEDQLQQRSEASDEDASVELEATEPTAPRPASDGLLRSETPLPSPQPDPNSDLSARQAESDEPEFTAEEWDRFLDEELERRLREARLPMSAREGVQGTPQAEIPQTLPSTLREPAQPERRRVVPQPEPIASASSRQAPELQPAEARGSFARQARTDNPVDDVVALLGAPMDFDAAGHDTAWRVITKALEGRNPESKAKALREFRAIRTKNRAGSFLDPRELPWLLDKHFGHSSWQLTSALDQEQQTVGSANPRLRRQQSRSTSREVPQGETRAIDRPSSQDALASGARANPTVLAESDPVALSSSESRVPFAYEEPTPFRREDASNKNIDAKLKAPSNQTDIDPNTGTNYSLPKEIRDAFTPSTDLTQATAVSRLAAAYDAESPDKGKRGFRPTRLQPVKRPAHLAANPRIKAAEEIGAAVGRPITWFKPVTLAPFNGGVMRGERRIFLNVNSTVDPVDQVVAHEATHVMEREAPEIYREYQRAVLEAAANQGNYNRDRLRRGYDPSQLAHELVADFTAEAIRNPARLQAVLGNNPSLWERVIGFLRDVIDRVARRVSSSRSVTATDAITDLRAAHRAMERAWSEWHSTRRKSTSNAGATTGPNQSLSADEFESQRRDIPDSESLDASEQPSNPRSVQQFSRPQTQSNDPRFQRQEPNARKELLLRLIDENIDDLLSGKLTKADLISMANQRRRVTSTKNAVTAKERESRGIAAAEEAAKRDFGTVWTEMQKKVAEEPGAAGALVDRLVANARPVKDVENAMLLQQQITLQNEYEAASRELDRAQTDLEHSEASARLERAREQLEVIYDVNKKVGTELGRGLNARKMLAAQDFTLARIEATIRSAVGNGKPLPKAEKDRIAKVARNVHDRIAKAGEKIAEYERRQRIPGRGGLANRARIARERIKALTGQRPAKSSEARFSRQDPGNLDEDYAIVGAELIDNGAADFDQWAAQMESEFGAGIPRLPSIFARAQQIHMTLIGRQLETRKKRVRDRIAKLVDRTARKDTSKRPKKSPPIDKELENLLYEEALAKEAYYEVLVEAELANRTKVQKGVGIFRETLNTSRVLLTFADLPPIFRQAGFMTYAAPIRTLKAVPAAFKAMFSEQGQFAVMEEIRRRDNYMKYLRDKLELTEIGPNTSLAKMEENVMSRWIQKVPRWTIIAPLVRASARGYGTLLNRVRADSYDTMEWALTRTGNVTSEEGRAIATHINDALGRSKITSSSKRGQESAAWMNTLFFAPRLVWSRFRIATGASIVSAPTPRVRKLIATQYGKMLVGLGMVHALAWLAGADEPEPDPRSSDFGKIRFGKTRLDPMFGLSQVIVFMARTITGETKTTKGEVKGLRNFWRPLNLFRDRPGPAKGKGPYDPDQLGVTLKFTRSKLAPAPGTIWNLSEEKDFNGQPTSPMLETERMITPMSFPDIAETLEEQGMEKGAALSFVSLWGMGISTYADRKKKPTLESLEDEMWSRKLIRTLYGD